MHCLLIWAWRGLCTLGLFVIAFVAWALTASFLGSAASRPFAWEISRSDLVSDGGGGVWVAVDLSRWTPAVSHELFADSGGWFAALWPVATLGIVGSVILWFLLMFGLSRCMYAARGWLMLVWFVPALLLAVWIMGAACEARAQSSSTGNWASTLAGCEVGTPVAYVAVLSQGAATVLGGWTGMRWKRKRRSTV